MVLKMETEVKYMYPFLCSGRKDRGKKREVGLQRYREGEREGNFFVYLVGCFLNVLVIY